MISEFDIRLGELLKTYGFVENFQLEFLKGGKNNRVFSIRSETGKTLLLKSYFKHPEDPRDRLATEYSFLTFAREAGIKCIPQPLAMNSEGGLGLYEFIEGRALNSTEINEDVIRQTYDFYLQLNQNKEQAQTLPLASEACFSLHEHCQLVDKRLKRLASIEGNTTLNREALGFVSQDLITSWQKIKTSIQQKMISDQWSWKNKISSEDRCISPSDFGYHNALMSEQGKMYFIDFEYAGWDDPAQMVCDFFSQVEVPVAEQWLSLFTDKVLEPLGNPGFHQKRIELLLPVHQLKWCCIVLNDFLSVGDHRRQFSGDKSEERKEIQLMKAKNLLEQI